MENFKKNLVSQVEREYFCDDCMSLVKAYKRACAIVAFVAMSSATLNSAEPVKVLPIDAEQLTQSIATPNQEKEVSTINFHQAQQKQKKHPYLPGGFAYLDMQEAFRAKMDGVEMRIILAKCDESKNASPNQVDKIYFIPPDYPDYKDENLSYLPQIIELVYHDLPNGKEYLGVKTAIYTFSKNGLKKPPVAVIYAEHRINDRAAQYLLDLRTGDTQWINKTGIPIRFTTDPNVKPMEVISLVKD